MSFKKGEDVMAKWPGSSLYFRAKILDSVPTTDTKIAVLFEEGTEFTIDKRFIKKESFFAPNMTKKKSPSRSKSPSRGRPKSPSRARSPARRKSPARSKSPSRSKVTQSSPPSVKSPEKRTSQRKSPARTKPTVVDDLQGKMEAMHKEISTLEELTKLSKKLEIEDESPTMESLTRRTRSATSKQTMKDKESNDLKDKKEPIKDLVSKEFGGSLGSLVLMTLIPAFYLASNLYSAKKQCGIYPVCFPKTWQSYFNPQAFGFYVGYILYQSILSLVPIGKLVDGQPDKSGRRQYRCNGFLNLLFSLLTFGILHYLKIPIVATIYSKWIQFLVSAYIFGLILAVALYIKGRKASVAYLNSHGQSGSFLYDFFMGKELNPYIWKVNVKLLLVKSAVISGIILNIVLILKGIEKQPVSWNSSLWISAGFQMFYLVDHFMFESSFLSTFTTTSEGTGYLTTVGLSLFPFFNVLITKFLLENRIERQWYILALLGLVYTIGYVIYRGSNSQKDQFRRNPLNPALGHLETIPTNRGKKLLVSSWWGWLRHPNYVGSLIMNWSFVGVIGLTHWFPYIMPALTSIFLIHRAVRDDHRCRVRYNSAWDQYCSRVKYRVIPKVF